MVVIPAAVALVLSLPCVGVPYFWDDYLFLTRAQDGARAALEHTPGAAFYRPISQGLYFLALAPFGASGALVAHLVNLLLVVISTTLLVLLVRDVWGRVAGMYAGIFYASVAPLPSLVAWASGSQDLLAITFLLGALLLRQRGRLAWSVVAAGAGLLSKESILVAWPVLIHWDVLAGRARQRVGVALLAFGAIALAWLLLHPGLRVALAPPAEGDIQRYVGFRNLAVSEHQVRGYLGALVNIPVMAPVSAVPAPVIDCGAIAMVIGLVGVIAVRRSSADGTEPRPSLARAALVGLLLAIPGVILPSLIINRWVAYYACLPALGTALFLGALCGRLPTIPAAAILIAWMGLGVYSRGMDSSNGVLNERSFLEGGRAIRHVETQFRELHPSLPKGSQVLVSVASSGMLGIHGTLVDGQAPRVWYDDASLETVTPERRLPDRTQDVLLRITSDQRVIEILPDSMAYRATDSAPVDEEETHMVLRTYARGLAASGEPGRAARILQTLALRDRREPIRSQDLRLAAMALHAGGEQARAESLLAAAPSIRREFALSGIARILSQPSRQPDVDTLAYWAFGISPDDPDALRYWMVMFYGSEFYLQAQQMAERLQAARPGDPEAGEVASKARVRYRLATLRN